MLKKPFFVASRPKGTGFDCDNVMSDQNSRDFMCAQARRGGLGGMLTQRHLHAAAHESSSTDEETTTYTFRIAALPAFQERWGDRRTKTIVNHEQHSDILNKHYSNLVSSLNLVSVESRTANREIGQRGVCDAPALFRLVRLFCFYLSALKKTHIGLLFRSIRQLASLLRKLCGSPRGYVICIGNGV